MFSLKPTPVLCVCVFVKCKWTVVILIFALKRNHLSDPCVLDQNLDAFIVCQTVISARHESYTKTQRASLIVPILTCDRNGNILHTAQASPLWRYVIFNVITCFVQQTVLFARHVNRTLTFSLRLCWWDERMRRCTGWWTVCINNHCFSLPSCTRCNTVSDEFSGGCISSLCCSVAHTHRHTHLYSTLHVTPVSFSISKHGTSSSPPLYWSVICTVTQSGYIQGTAAMAYSGMGRYCWWSIHFHLIVGNDWE